MKSHTSEPGRATSGVLIPPPLIYIAALLIATLFNHYWPIAAGIPPGTWIAAVILVLVAFGIQFAALPQFWRARTSLSVLRPTTSLITTGPYRYSRNPLYVGLTLAYLGFAILFNLLVWALVLLPVVVLVIQTYVIAREERYLEQRFGQAYRDYKARVRRWL